MYKGPWNACQKTSKSYAIKTPSRNTYIKLIKYVTLDLGKTPE